MLPLLLLKEFINEALYKDEPKDIYVVAWLKGV